MVSENHEHILVSLIFFQKEGVEKEFMKVYSYQKVTVFFITL